MHFGSQVDGTGLGLPAGLAVMTNNAFGPNQEIGTVAPISRSLTKPNADVKPQRTHGLDERTDRGSFNGDRVIKVVTQSTFREQGNFSALSRAAF